MPFTPFHFGPGLFLKSLGSRYFSFLSFVATQVVIDCETLYFIMRRDYPVHRTLHTFVGATIAGFITSLALIASRTVVCKISSRFDNPPTEPWPVFRSESSTIGILIGGIIGGASHPFLDGIMHPDVRPFAPWSENNPLLTMIGIGTLHVGCILSGMVGLLLLLFASMVYHKNHAG